ncbi:MAG: carbamoyltransferase, partial [Proteobacteria bacterium]
AAALVVDGKLVAAAEEERFRRLKHWAGFPSESIRYCLGEAGLALEDVDVLAINQDSKANLWKKLGFTLAKRPDLKYILEKVRTRRDRAGIGEQIEAAFPGSRFNGRVAPVEHHLAHLSSAFHVSPFDEAVVVSVDGFGDFASGAWGVGRGSRIEVENRVYFPHSLGNFYQALTQYLGFPHYGDEYKVMGLAPYGEPRFVNEMRRVVQLVDDGGYRLNLDYFVHHRENVVYEWDGGEPVFGRIYSNELEALLGPARRPDEEITQRHRDIAHSIQAMYEEAFFHLLDRLHERHGVDELALAGGCAMNSVANGKIYRRSRFKRAYIQSAAGDAGGAIGAAFAAWHGAGGKPRDFVMNHAYWGPSFSGDEIRGVLDSHQSELESASCRIEKVEDRDRLCDLTARAVADGKVVGWFQGRMEWGPRALGNRSIVCDPRRADIKDILNSKIKRRESFRPFAPSILRESAGEWFEENDDVPFMMKVFQVREEKRAEIPAVTHVDGSGRLQTVYRDTNPRYYRLIESFRDLTGIPIVLNTSFNENEPVVCAPEEALACFLRTRMDLLVIGDFMISRPQA